LVDSARACSISFCASASADFKTDANRLLIRSYAASSVSGSVAAAEAGPGAIIAAGFSAGASGPLGRCRAAMSRSSRRSVSSASTCSATCFK